MADPVVQYLQRHAEPEAGAVLEVSHERAVVVPVRDESVDFLEGLRPAAVTGNRTPLLIVVVNASRGGSRQTSERNAVLLEALTGRRRPAVLELVEHEGLDLVVVDRSSPGRELPPDQGVGLARKIGCDLALALWNEGRLASPWIRTTDADATLDPGDLNDPQGGPPEAVALLRPVWHTPSGQCDVDRATALYELWLRYYVAGLAWSGSPWAMLTIGSAIAVHARAYASVRGVPPRQAGEDFHLLAKLAKLGPVDQPDTAVMHLRSRLSSRVPFGTGPGVERIVQQRGHGRDVPFYDPRTFEALRALLVALEEAAQRGAVPQVGPAPWWESVLHRLGGWDRLRLVLRRTADPATRHRRVHEWLDGHRTLRLIHAMRDLVVPDLPWVEALGRAPFGPAGDLDLADPLLEEARTQLAGCAPARVGLHTSGYRFAG